MNIDRGGRFDLTEVKFVDGEAPKLLQRGDVLFNNTNSPELIGKTAVISSDAQLAFSNHMTRIRLEAGMNPTFVARQLHYLWMTGYFRHRCKNHVNQASIAGDPLARSVPLIVPPPEEQARIADTLDELLSDLDAGVAALQSVRVKLRHYRVAVLKAAVEGALTADWRREHPTAETADALLHRVRAERRRRWEGVQLAKFKTAGKTAPAGWNARYSEPTVPETADLPQLPETWRWTSAEQLTEFITKGTTPPGSDGPGTAGEIPFLKVQHLSETGAFHFFDSPAFVSRESHATLLARSKVFPGDVLMNIVGPPLGQVSVIPGDYPEWNMNQAIAVFRPLGDIPSKFIAICLLSVTVQSQALRRSKTTAGQVNLTLEVCRELAIPLPPLREQQAIVEAAEDHLSIIDHLEGDIEVKITSTQALRQSILRHAFSGQLVPQDPNDEPASELLRRIGAEREERARLARAAKQAKPATRTTRTRARKQ